MTVVCHCGGETQLEHFSPGSRPVEWFMRCSVCRCMSDVAGAPDLARDMPIRPAFPDTTLESRAA